MHDVWNTFLTGDAILRKRISLRVPLSSSRHSASLRFTKGSKKWEKFACDDSLPHYVGILRVYTPKLPIHI